MYSASAQRSISSSQAMALWQVICAFSEFPGSSQVLNTHLPARCDRSIPPRRHLHIEAKCRSRLVYVLRLVEPLYWILYTSLDRYFLCISVIKRRSRAVVSAENLSMRSRSLDNASRNKGEQLKVSIIHEQAPARVPACHGNPLVLISNARQGGRPIYGHRLGRYAQSLSQLPRLRPFPDRPPW